MNPDKGGSDFINELRLVIEKEKSEGGMGMHLVYINGASGDLNMTPKAQSTHPDYLAMGRSVANSIQKLVGSSKEKKWLPAISM